MHIHTHPSKHQLHAFCTRYVCRCVLVMLCVGALVASEGSVIYIHENGYSYRKTHTKYLNFKFESLKT